jgi:crossover junction endodeoxyribonuclease RuvC
VTVSGETVIVLGVDPGTLSTGYGVVQRTGSGVRLVTSGAISNPSTRPLPDRLRTIHDVLTGIIGRYHPHEFAIETAFYGKNAQSALKLGHARGVAILCAVQRGLPTTEYSPRAVKKSVVGTGAASKEQVQYMVREILRLGPQTMPLDASDAVAVAICHLQHLSTPSKLHRDWKSFVEAHPDRVRR